MAWPSLSPASDTVQPWNELLSRTGQKGLNPAWFGGGECGVLSCCPVHGFPGSPHPVLLLTKGPEMTGPLGWPRSECHFITAGFTPDSWGWQSPEATLKGHSPGSAAPSTLHIPSRCPVPPASQGCPPAGRSCHPTVGVSLGARPAAAPAPARPRVPLCWHVSPAILSSPAVLRSPGNGTVYYYYCWLPTS